MLIALYIIFVAAFSVAIGWNLAKVDSLPEIADLRGQIVVLEARLSVSGIAMGNNNDH